MPKVRVLLADDHALFREGVRMVLEAQGDFVIVGEAGNAAEAIQEAKKSRPDIVVMDISMEGSGLEATRQVRQALPETKIVVLTMHADDDYLFQALEAGAAGYVVKGATSADLVAALRAAARGEVFIYPSVAKFLVADYLTRVRSGEEQNTYAKLSDREKEILGLIAQGFANPEIAERLYISVHTVQSHRGHIMEKLGLHSRGELLKYAVRFGFLRTANPRTDTPPHP